MATAVVARMRSELHIEFGCTLLRPLQEVDRKSYTVVGSGEDMLYISRKQTGKTIFLQRVDRNDYIIAQTIHEMYLRYPIFKNRKPGHSVKFKWPRSG